jgi:formiminotetrahydrofolate cyclodeaminase
MSEEDSEGTSEEEDEEESDEESTAIKDIWQAIKDDDEEAFASAFKIFKNC